MVHCLLLNGRKHNGTNSKRQRHGDARRPSGNSASHASLAQLSETYNINPKTFAKWRKQDGVDDHKTGPKEPRLSVFVTNGGGRDCRVSTPYVATTG